MPEHEWTEAMFDYHCTSTAKLAGLAETLSDEELDTPIVGGERSIRETLKHIVEVDWMWRTVLETGQLPNWAETPARSLHQVPDIATAHRAESAALKRWLGAHAGDTLNEAIEVQFPWSPQPQPFVPWRVLLQIPLHGQQHRSEIAVELSRLNKSPGFMDFIFLG